MSLAFSDCLTHFLNWHLPIIELSIPDTEGSTRWTAYDPFWVLLIYHAPGQLAIGAIVEIPRLSVWLQSSQVERIQALNIKKPAVLISLSDNAALTKHLNKRRLSNPIDPINKELGSLAIRANRK